jgi:hypothetical protein
MLVSCNHPTFLYTITSNSYRLTSPSAKSNQSTPLSCSGRHIQVAYENVANTTHSQQVRHCNTFLWSNNTLRHPLQKPDSTFDTLVNSTPGLETELSLSLILNPVQPEKPEFFPSRSYSKQRFEMP